MGWANRPFGQGQTCRVHKQIVHTFPRLRRTLHVRIGVDASSDLSPGFVAHGFGVFCFQSFDGGRIAAQVDFAGDEDHGTRAAEMPNLGIPFLDDVARGRGIVHTETDQDDVGVGIRQRSETGVDFLTSRVEQRQTDLQNIGGKAQGLRGLPGSLTVCPSS